MRRSFSRTWSVVAWPIAVVLASSLGASSVQQATKRPALYVVAVRDSGVLTMCPAVPEVTMNNGRTWKPDGRAVATFFTDDLQLLRFPPRTAQRDQRQADREIRDDPRSRTEISGTQVILPAPRTPIAAAGIATPALGRELGADIVSADPILRQTVERELVRLGRFDVAPTMDAADLVLIVEGSYIALSTSVTASTTPSTPDQPPAPLGTSTHWGDWPRNVLQSVLAIAIPVEFYRTADGDMQAILSGRTWEGSEVFQPPYQASERIPTTSTTRWETRRTWEPASPEAVVWQLAGMKPRPASHPPLCAASNRAFRSAAAALGSNVEDTAASGRGAALQTPKVESSGSMTAFKGGVTYVSVPVQVTDGEGRPVAGLDGSHFRIFEDDAAQMVDRVEKPGASVNVALLVDSSSSMRRQVDQSRAAIAAGLNVFSHLGVPVVVSFDRRVVLYSKPSAYLMHLAAGTGQPLVGRWATRLYDALDLVLSGPLRDTSQRAALVVLTDGVDTASRLADAETVRRRLSESHIPAYVVHFDTSRDNPPPPLGGGFELTVNDARPDMTRVLIPEGSGDPGPVHARAADFLRQIVDTTGGRLLVAPEPDDLEKAFGGIARELSEQYLVAYYPTNQNRDGTYRRIRIEVNKPGVTVRAREGYYQASTARKP